MIFTLLDSNKKDKVKEGHTVATKNRMSLLEQLSKYVVEKDKDF